MKVFLFFSLLVGLLMSVYLIRDGNRRIGKAVAEDDWSWVFQMVVGWTGVIIIPIPLVISVILLFL